MSQISDRDLRHGKLCQCFILRLVFIIIEHWVIDVLKTISKGATQIINGKLYQKKGFRKTGQFQVVGPDE